jgi:hypothetical protein
MAATNKRMKIGVWNFVWTQIVDVFTKSVLNISAVTNMATVSNFHVISANSTSSTSLLVKYIDMNWSVKCMIINVYSSS